MNTGTDPRNKNVRNMVNTFGHCIALTSKAKYSHTIRIGIIMARKCNGWLAGSELALPKSALFSTKLIAQAQPRTH